MEIRVPFINPAIGERDSPDSLFLGERDADRAYGVVPVFLRTEGFGEVFRDEFPADAGGEEFASVGGFFLVDDDFDFALFLHIMLLSRIG